MYTRRVWSVYSYTYITSWCPCAKSTVNNTFIMLYDGAACSIYLHIIMWRIVCPVNRLTHVCFFFNTILSLFLLLFRCFFSFTIRYVNRALTIIPIPTRRISVSRLHDGKEGKRERENERLIYFHTNPCTNSDYATSTIQQIVTRRTKPWGSVQRVKRVVFSLKKTVRITLVSAKNCPSASTQSGPRARVQCK